MKTYSDGFEDGLMFAIQAILKKENGDGQLETCCATLQSIREKLENEIENHPDWSNPVSFEEALKKINEDSSLACSSIGD